MAMRWIKKNDGAGKLNAFKAPESNGFLNEAGRYYHCVKPMKNRLGIIPQRVVTKSPQPGLHKLCAYLEP